MEESSRSPQNPEDINFSIVTSIEYDGLEELTAGVLEFSLDQLLQNGVLREFPVVGAILALGKTGASVRDFLFLRKVFRFLYQLRDVSLEKRIEFGNRIREDSEYRRKVGENLLLILEKLNAFSKADMLGRVYKAHLTGNINTETLEKLVSAIERVNLHDLDRLRQFYVDDDENSREDEQLQNLAFAGLVCIQLGEVGLVGGVSGQFKQCEIGRMFLKYAICDNHEGCA